VSVADPTDGIDQEPDDASEVTTQVGPWAMVPAWVLGMGLTGAEWAVYVALRSFADRSGGARPKVRTIAERAAVSERTVERAIARFRTLGMLRSQRIYSRDGREIIGCHYMLRDTPPAPAQSPPPDGLVGGTPTAPSVTPDGPVGAGTHQGTHQGTPSAATQPRADDDDVTTLVGDGSLPGMPPAPPGPPPTPVRRAQALTAGYVERVPLSNFAAVLGIVRKAIDVGRYTDQAIDDALTRLATSGRSVTTDALRTELEGLPAGRRAGSTTDARVQAGMDLVGRYAQREGLA
jgi:hypothetical protein